MTNKYGSVEELVRETALPVYLIVPDIRSAYNVGAMFRTADGTGQTGIILAGYSPTPENPKVTKTALGAESTVPWCYIENCHLLSTDTLAIHVGLELTNKSLDLFEWSPSFDKPIFLYVGNEVTGLPVELMMSLETFVKLPMNGIKASLNVAEAASIAIYELLRKSGK